MTRNSEHRFFYGTVIVLASFFTALVIHGMWSTYGVFFSPIQSEFGWSRATVSGASSVAFFLMGASSVLTGRLTDRFGPRRILIIYGIILGAGYLLMSRTSSVWHLYLSYGLIVGPAASAGDASLLPTIARWFVQRRGIMTAVLKVGSGTGFLVMPPLATWLILTRGWRSSYFFLAVVTMAVMIVAAQFMKRDPLEKGLHPYGVPKEHAGGGHSLRQAIQAKQLWVVCLTYFLLWYSTQTIMVHIVPYALDLQISAPRAAGMVSLIGTASIVGRLVMGATADRTGSRQALTISFAVLVAAFSWLQVAKGLWALYVFVTIYGFAHGAFFTLLSPLVAELFGMRSHGAILGVVLATGQVGGAIGPVVSGRIFDVSRSYQLAFIVLLAASVIGLVLSTLIRSVRAEEEYLTVKDAAP